MGFDSGLAAEAVTQALGMQIPSFHEAHDAFGQKDRRSSSDLEGGDVQPALARSAKTSAASHQRITNRACCARCADGQSRSQQNV